MSNNLPWIEKHFTQSQEQDITFCHSYKLNFSHKPEGYQRMIILATMAELLTKIHYALAPTGHADGEWALRQLDEISEIMGHKNE